LPGLTRQSIGLNEALFLMDARVTSAFTLVIDALLPAHDVVHPLDESGLTRCRFAPRTPAPRGPSGLRCVSRPAVLSGASAKTCRFRQAGTEEGAILEQAGQEDAMTKRHEAKYKIDRRMGQNVWGRPKSPVNRREYGPGQHGQRRKGKLSDYGVQLRAKQKLRGYYGNISERQFRGIYAEAIRMKGDSGAHMIALLERRLDAMVYRAKLVPTVFAARQFVSHGHIKVNGRRVTIPSYRVKLGDVIEVKDQSKQLAIVLEAVGLAERDVPDYIEVDHSKMTAKLTRIPQLTEVPYPVQMEPHLVVEFYSR
jgi:small subunit ribosomal protein S4